MARDFYRASKDMGLERTRKWIEKWYGNSAGLCIERVSIPCPTTALAELEADQRFVGARAMKQSALHAYLKYASLLWLEGVSGYPETIRCEARCYSPIDELTEGVRAFINGKRIDIASPCVLPKGDRYFPLDRGHLICVDVFAADISMEVGDTKPFNLLTPFLDGLVEKAVWVPYPADAAPASFELDGKHRRPVTAYVFSDC